MQQHFLDARVGEDLAARGADAREDGFRDAPRAAYGIEAAMQVVFRDQRLHHPRGSLRWQAEVAPLAGEHGDEFRVRGDFGEHLPGRAAEAAGQAAAEIGARDCGGPGRQRAAEREGPHAARHFAQQFEVAVDRGGFAREVAHDVVAERLASRDRVVGPVADEEPVVMSVHRRPVEVALRQEVHHAARGRPRAHVADVVDADVPFVAVAVVAVRGAAGRVVLLEHRHAPADLREQRGRREPADPRADDERVVRAVRAASGDSGGRCAACWG